MTPSHIANLPHGLAKVEFQDNMLGNFCVSLMEYSFLHKDLEQSDMTFAACT